MAHERVVVLGASGPTGRLVVRSLARWGAEVVAVGRSPDRLAAVVEDLPGVTAEVADVAEPAALRGLLDAGDVVVTTIGPFDVRGRSVLDVALDAGVSYVDVAVEQPFVAWARAARHARAHAAGVTVVAGAGVAGLPGDLLAALAAEQVTGPCEVHVAHALPDGVWRGASAGTRRSLATLVGAPAIAHVAGRQVEERVGESRRLAWFPRPVGPRHAAAVPGLEPLTVPDHLPQATLVRTYLSLSTAGSEALQALGNLARWEPARTRLRSALTPAPGARDQRDRTRMRWACVAEVATDVAVGRAWASGHDPHALSAASASAVVERILTGEVPPGVVAPARLGPAGDLLDRVGATSDLRWGRAVSDRPTARSR